MREILFRGKRNDNGEWVFGSLSMEYYAECGSVMISPTSDTCYKVIPETVGQFTGLTDKTGKMIFEGDIVKFRWCEKCELFSILFDNGAFLAVPPEGYDSKILWKFFIGGENKK